MFIGYVATQKAYKAYDFKTKKIYIIRDIKFYENEFPFASASLSVFHISNSDSLSLPLVSLETPFDCDFTNSSLSISPTTSSNNNFNDSSSASTTDTIHPTASDPNPSQIIVPPRLSERTKKPPFWLANYVCNISITHHFISDFSYDYVAFASKVSKIQEPYTYKEATKDPEWI